MILIVSGEPGTGKTFQCMYFEEAIRYLDLENRAEEKRNRFFSDKLIEIKQLLKYDANFNEDQIGSFNAFQSEVHTLIKSEPPQTVVIDGISELRDYANAKWCKDNTRKRAINPGDWSQINDMVRDTLFPLINWSRVKGNTVIFTSQYKDDYGVIEKDGKKESVKTGRVPAHKDWIGYNVDVLVDLVQYKGRYNAVVTKSPVGVFEEDLTGRSLCDLLIEKQVI